MATGKAEFAVAMPPEAKDLSGVREESLTDVEVAARFPTEQHQLGQLARLQPPRQPE
jgi:hypothetical protein